MKEPSSLLGQTYLTSRDMRKVAMQTAETISTREDPERLVKILDITYEKADLEQVAANANHMNSEEINKLLILLKYLRTFSMAQYRRLGYRYRIPWVKSQF